MTDSSKFYTNYYQFSLQNQPKFYNIISSEYDDTATILESN